MDDKNEQNRVAMFSIHADPLAAIGSRESGGQNVYIRNLVINLDKRGRKIDVFTRLDDPKKKTVAKIGKNSRVIRLKDGKPTYIPKGQLHPYFPGIYREFLKFIDSKNPYKLFHGHHYDGGLIALMAHRKFHKPLIVNFHSLGRVRFQTQRQYSIDVNERKVLEERFEIEQKIIEEASLIISLADTEKRDLNLLYGANPDKIKVIPGGVDIKEFMPASKNKAREILRLSKEDFILLFVGRLEWRKGIGTLISSAKLLREFIPNIKALIVGGKIFGLRKNKDDWNEYQRLLKKAEEEEVSDNMRFVGRVDQGRLPLFYSAADILVIPSYYEPFGLVALEGMASQIPIIASRKGGLRLTVKDGQTGLLFEPRNPFDLREKVLRIYRSQELTALLIKNAYQDVLENYSWSYVSEKINNIYESFISL
jgi:D-inositol-3-phosphate glycosyltransferase